MSPAADAQSGTDLGARRRAVELLEQHFAITEPGGNAGQRFETVRQAFRKVDGRVLVVTAPDPIESKVGYTFDQQVDALHDALDGDYEIDRFSLPWRTDGETRELRVRSPQNDEAGALLRAVWERRQSAGQMEPGAILFRSNPGSTSGPGLLLVLLVGEMPTSGVQSVALFTNAHCQGPLCNPSRSRARLMSHAISEARTRGISEPRRRRARSGMTRASCG